MSWFTREYEGFDLTVENEQGHVVPPGHEIAPGVEVERSGVFSFGRRGLLKAAGAAAALFATGQASFAQEQQKVMKRLGSDLEPISLKTFIAEAEKLASALVKDKKPNEDAYLLYLASLLCRLGKTPGFDSKRKSPIQMRPNHRSPHFAIMQIKMAEGAAIPFHDHYEYNGVILGLEGKIHVRNFEMLGKEVRPPENKSFELRETTTTVLTPGRISTLARHRDNIHDLRGGKGGGRVLDVFTFFPKSKGSKNMEVEDKPTKSGGNIYRAKWSKPQQRRKK